MSQNRVLDSYALLAYLNGEKGYQIVLDVLKRAQETGRDVIMNEINIGETYYILFRNKGEEKAEYFLETILMGLPITPYHNDLNMIIRASKIKARYPISYADCFAAATAERENGIVMTGDPEFKKIEGMINIEWVK